MPPSIAKIHPEVFHEWAYEGKSNTEPNYIVSKNFIKHKLGNLVVADKYIKQFITESG
jgi:hypothetical protein